MILGDEREFLSNVDYVETSEQKNQITGDIIEKKSMVL